MKRLFIICAFSCIAILSFSGVTTYSFTSLYWASSVGVQVCDGKSDGWVCDKPASEYMKGRLDANGVLYSQGVSVKTGTSGAGATSVQTFEGVRKIVFNFCLNQSKGKGVIYVQIGEDKYDSIIVAAPQKQQGQWLRDSTITYSQPRSGRVRFWIKCTENAININSLSILSSSGGSSVFNTSSFRLVTDVSQLKDSDQIIIGVNQAGVNYIMGFFDEEVSQNNIHAIKGKYDSDRQTVATDNRAIYTLRKTVTSKGVDAWYIQDELRYEEAYLVASGGSTKNVLALWNNLYDNKSYGDFGYWDIQIDAEGNAVIANLGNSTHRYLQYNGHNSPTLFGCYEQQKETPVCIYQEVQALGDIPAIAASRIHFPIAVLSPEDEYAQGLQTVSVQGNKLTDDINVALKEGVAFSVDRSVIDREGGSINISFKVSEENLYKDTLILSSGEVVTEVPIQLKSVREKNISRAVQSSDYEHIWLGEVVVTKKFDSYIFVRDATGSMLIYDGGDGTGKRYGAGLSAGDVLIGVNGLYHNYFGVPELSPSTAWKVASGKQDISPDIVQTVDSADVCRFVRLNNVTIVDGMVNTGDCSVVVEDKFGVGLTKGVPANIDAIVYINHDVLTLWVIRQSFDSTSYRVSANNNKYKYYNILGMEVSDDYNGMVIKVVQH